MKVTGRVVCAFHVSRAGVTECHCLGDRNLDTALGTYLSEMEKNVSRSFTISLSAPRELDAWKTYLCAATCQSCACDRHY